MAGWIKIYQSIREHWVWERPLYLKWWLDLLMLAEWKDTTQPMGGTVVVIKRGQLVASLRHLCERWAYRKDEQPNSPLIKPQQKTVQKFLRLLEDDGMIERDTTTMPNHTALITICNYDSYQLNQGVQDSTPDSTNEIIPDGKCDENIEIEEVTYNSSPTTDVDREFSFAEELKQDNNQLFWEQSCMALHCNMSILKSLLSDFTSEIVANHKWHRDFSDFRQHFYSWCRYAVQRIHREQTMQKQDGRNTINRRDNAVEQRQQRGAEYASHIAAKLGLNPGGEELH